MTRTVKAYAHIPGECSCESSCGCVPDDTRVEVVAEVTDVPNELPDIKFTSVKEEGGFDFLVQPRHEWRLTDAVDEVLCAMGAA